MTDISRQRVQGGLGEVSLLGNQIEESSKGGHTDGVSSIESLQLFTQNFAISGARDLEASRLLHSLCELSQRFRNGGSGWHGWVKVRL